MERLLIDIGNSCSKFAIYDGHQIKKIASYENRRIDSAQENIQLNIPKSINEVFISCVANKKIKLIITQRLIDTFKINPIVLNVQEQCCGLNTTYKPYKSLGIDRWLSMIGAMTIYDKDFTVIDLGTAITVDTVLDNIHIGGFIAPGLDILQNSLLDKTSINEVIKKQLPGDLFLPPTNTSDALSQGGLIMLLSYVNHVVNMLQDKYGKQHKFILTGGNSIEIKHRLQKEITLEANLIFYGMNKVIQNFK